MTSPRCHCGLGSLARRSVRAGSRPGVTFLEAVFATVLLGMVAATLAGVSAALRRGDERERQMLGAAEMANRLVIMYADDPTMMPSEGLPVWYGPEGSDRGFFYRWSLTEGPVEIQFSEAGAATAAARSSGADFTRRINVVTVNVWLSEDSGGGFKAADGIPRATISRLVDTIGFFNADRDQRKLQREGVMGMMEGLLNTIGTSEGGSRSTRSLGGEQATRDAGGER